MITNGDFDTDTDWAKSLFQITGGYAESLQPTFVSSIRQYFSTTRASIYLIEFEVISYTGSGKLTVGLICGGWSRLYYYTPPSAGNYSIRSIQTDEDPASGGAPNQLAFAIVTGTLRIDNVSVKKVTPITKTGDLDYEIHAADSATELYDNVVAGSAKHTGTLTDADGRGTTIRTKTVGGWMGVVLRNDTINESFSVEKISGNIVPAGRMK